MSEVWGMFCYLQAVRDDTVWGFESPLVEALPVLVLQMTLAMSSNLLFLYILRPLHQPRIVVDIIGALAVSPFIMGTISEPLVKEVWPKRGSANLEVLANLGLLYAMFIKGLQMDLTPITHRRGTKTLALSLGVITLPFLAGTAMSFFFSYHEINHLRGHGVFMYWGAVIASSSFPTMAAIVARQKLLCTDIGRSALSIGMVNDVGSWLFIVIIIALSAIPPPSESHGLQWAPFLSVITFTVGFMAFCFGIIRPCIAHLIKNNKEGENFSESTIHVLLFMVMASGMVADFFGAYAFLGAFILGLSIPHGFLAQTLVEKMDDCATGILIPLYLVNVGTMMKPPSNFFSDGGLNMMLIVLSALAKPLCVFLYSTLCAVPVRDGIALSVLLNAKGLLSIVIASVGYERKHLSREAVTVLVFVILISTMVVEPVMALAYNRLMKCSVLYDNRTVSGLKAEEEFRVISCIHGPRNIPGIVNLLEVSSVSPMSIFPLHLLELLGRSSAMLIVHESHGTNNGAVESPNSSTVFTKTRALSEQIINSFENYQRQHSATTSVQTLTIVSPMDTMHEDICSLAEEKQVSMILLPFHKNQGMDGRLEDDENIEIRSVNQNVMSTSPCSLGLLIDRGIGRLPIGGRGGSSHRESGAVRAVMFFFGGPDDREALSYARRLARHSLVSLTVIRFVAGSNPVDVKPIIFPDDEENEEEKGIQTIYTENDLEKQMDNRFIARLLERSNSNESIQYVEMASNSGADTVGLMREMDHRNYDLYIVGRGRQVLSPMTAGLLEWSECPELGAIGDVLVTSDVAPEVSVLVVQLYAGARDLPPKDATVVEF